MDCAPSLGATCLPAPSPAKHLPPRLGRRPFLRGVGGLALAALASAWSPLAVAEAGTSRPGALARVPWGERMARPLAQGAAAETVYVFNVGSRDVTLIDAATRQVRETRPLGAQVRWLSNIQPHWDGQYVWTYDFPDNRLQAIAIDPQTVVVARTVADIGTGPGHSLVLLADPRKAAVNVAGDDVIAFLDLPSGQVEAATGTGAFP